MTNHYHPPLTEVHDVAPIKRATWLRVLTVGLPLSVLSLILSWGVAPEIAMMVARILSLPLRPPAPAALFLDLMTSAILIFGVAYLAARLAWGRELVVVLVIASVEWAVYFAEVGGLSGMLKSQFPVWYEFTPSNFGPCMLAAWLAIRWRSPPNEA